MKNSINILGNELYEKRRNIERTMIGSDDIEFTVDE